MLFFQSKLFTDFLHPIILYSFVGTLLGYLLIKLCLNLFRIQEPGYRIRLLFVPLLIPFLFFLLRPVVGRTCVLLFKGQSPLLLKINQLFCDGGRYLTTFLTPFFFAAVGLAVVKGGLSYFACRRIVKKYGYARPDAYPRLFALLQKITERFGIEPPPVVVTTQRSLRSFTFGFFQPVIILSKGVLEALDDEELEALLAHEIAHGLRYDSFFNWTVVFFRDLLFFAPAVFWIFRDLMLEKEVASDDITIRITGNRYALGEALIKVWRGTRSGSFWERLALENFSPGGSHFVAGRGTLRARLERIVSLDGVEEERRSRVFYFALATGVLFTVGGLLYYLC